MASLESYLDDLLRHGRAYFSRNDVADTLGLKPQALAAALTRAINKHRLANPRHGFYLILRPEDQIAGAPDPVKWIDPLMKHQGIDYRISLLRAAAFHGASHQASMVFQVVVPRQLRDFDLGRHRLQFLYQGPDAFSQVNQSSLVDQMKSDAGFATVAGVELTLLDCVRYFHKAAGINGVAHDANVGLDLALGCFFKADFTEGALQRLHGLGEFRCGRWFGGSVAEDADFFEPFDAGAKSFKPDG